MPPDDLDQVVTVALRQMDGDGESQTRAVIREIDLKLTLDTYINLPNVLTLIYIGFSNGKIVKLHYLSWNQS